jgi:predicted alpha-1,6-mannanase (GH76 family)
VHHLLVLAALGAVGCARQASTLPLDASTPSMDAGVAADAGAPSDANGVSPDAGPSDPPFDAGPIDPVIAAGPDDDWHAHDNAALAAFAGMYDTHAGIWTTGPKWSFANGVEAAEASFLRSGGENHLDLIVATFDQNAAGKFIDDNGYDDEAWWAHAWVRAYDLTGDTRYLDAAKFVFNDMTTAWDTGTCGGGIWWSRNRDYKNAITNELFLLLGASLHNRTAGDTGPTSYLAWALKEWAWFDHSGMINGSGLINDGLVSSGCQNNGQTTWTYNQGIVLGGLVELYEATGDATYLTRAEQLADASTSKLVDANGIFQEPCAASGCDGDQVSFKGLYVRNLARLYDHDHQARYFDFMVANARSAWTHDKNAGDAFGTSWSGPFDAASAPRQSSAMFPLSSLADVRSSASLFLRPSAGPSFNHAMGARDHVLGWACDAASCKSAGLMQSGPFVSYLPPGAHTLHVRVAVDKIASAATLLATLKVVDQTANMVLATKTMAWSDFAEANVAQDFAVPYTQSTAGHAVEYQVAWSAAAGAPRLVLTDVSVDGEQSFTGANLGHECGQLDGSWHWSADRFSQSQPCFLTRGAAVRLDAGDYAAHFELRVDEFALDDALLATLSVFDRETGAAVASLDVHRTQFASTRFQLFSLPFHAPAGHHWELRIRWQAAATAPRLRVRGVHLRRAAHATPVSLPFNQRGLGAAPGDGALDNVGSTLDTGLLGAQLDAGYQHFVLGQAGNNVLQGSATQVTVPQGQYRTLELLGLAVNGSQLDQAFTIFYSDGTSQKVTRSLSDWIAAAPLADEQIARVMPYRWSTTAKEYGNFHLFQYSLPVDATRSVKAFQLPANANVKILAATLTGP